jgi:hypothetical protein
VAVDPTRLFSLREANGLIDTLQREFTRARSLREELMGVQRLLSEAGAPLSGPEVRVDETAAPPVRKLQERAVKAVGALRDLLRELSELGLEVKAADGLVDLPSKLHGRVVFLCWKYGEQRIEHWHELATGFAGSPCRRTATSSATCCTEP